MSATSGSRNIKPIFDLLPHVTEKFMTNFCTSLSDHRTKHELMVYLAESSRNFAETVAAL